MRVLIVTNMYPSRERPEFGVFVRDQLEALSRIDGVDIDLHIVEGGGKLNYLKGIRALRKHLKSRQYDIVHAHYGLTGWVARRAGAKPLVVTFHGNDLRDERVRKLSLRMAKRIDQVAVVSEYFGREFAGVKKTKRPIAVLPTGIDMTRFKFIDRLVARKQLGLDPEGSYALFPADPSREVKRFDRAQEVVATVEDLELLTLGGVPPAQVPVYMNAVDAVVFPTDFEAFGLVTVEALACNVPVITTPTGIAPVAIEGIEGAYCLEWDLASWHNALVSILDDPDPRVNGRHVAERYSTDAMAARVVAVYRDIVGTGS